MIRYPFKRAALVVCVCESPYFGKLMSHAARSLVAAALLPGHREDLTGRKRFLCCCFFALISFFYPLTDACGGNSPKTFCFSPPQQTNVSLLEF